ncbi:ribose 5-phosphate isomerase B [Slackia equolifaciens]|uniref:Ribose 5-phosphate isomerase B n=1 Tax=Slackia equolifaciens TaxID=498718 RepID=A0A3N0B4L4_9ACTN|nr:ribose 5-phosphate isomerase B [Slackia equolifaciens]RNL42052.1 ribose 5-phosphate isomerase B [Slackia equolifaciens]HJF64851.1 ribose 5-phosphate isomerase B [Slackia equolifaciens]
MIISIGSDHAGFEQKQKLVDYLVGEGYEVIDRGPDSDDRVDYPDYAAAVAHDVSNGTADRGVLVCGTGIGMALAADKVVGIRAANVINVQFAELCRQHNDANVVTLSGRFVDLETNKQIVDTFLTTKFEGGRHAMRVAKIMRLDADKGGVSTDANGNVVRG